MKRCSRSLGKWQIKSTLSYRFWDACDQNDRPWWQALASVSRDRSPRVLQAGMWNGAVALESRLAAPPEVSHGYLVTQQWYLPGQTQGSRKHVHRKKVYRNVVSSFLYASQNVETTPVSISWSCTWVDRMWSVLTGEYDSVFKRSGLLVLAALMGLVALCWVKARGGGGGVTITMVLSPLAPQGGVSFYSGLVISFRNLSGFQCISFALFLVNP